MTTMQTAIALRDDQFTFDDLQVAALAHMGVANASKADLAIFFHESKRTGLDPFARQIHMIGRNTKNPRTDKWETKFTIQTGIDGYRLIADRADRADGGYREYEDTQWCGPDGVWADVWTSDEPPVAARVVVLRSGRRFPAVARYQSYVQTKRDGSPNSIWAGRAAEQLEKCAEALALRKAYPRDLSGIYTDAEMVRADDEGTAHEAPGKTTGVGSLRDDLIPPAPPAEACRTPSSSQTPRPSPSPQPNSRRCTPCSARTTWTVTPRSRGSASGRTATSHRART
jgi:phage recombination protein Bet